MARILVIEDNENNLYLVQFLLETAGHEILSATNGPDGIREADLAQPDIILLDIQLPGMDGYAVARALRKQENSQEIPIVAVTSYAMPGDREKALEAGCDGYIEKPIDPDTFVASVESFLSGEVQSPTSDSGSMT